MSASENSVPEMLIVNPSSGVLSSHLPQSERPVYHGKAVVITADTPLDATQTTETKSNQMSKTNSTILAAYPFVFVFDEPASPTSASCEPRLLELYVLTTTSRTFSDKTAPCSPSIDKRASTFTYTFTKGVNAIAVHRLPIYYLPDLSRSTSSSLPPYLHSISVTVSKDITSPNSTPLWHALQPQPLTLSLHNYFPSSSASIDQDCAHVTNASLTSAVVKWVTPFLSSSSPSSSSSSFSTPSPALSTSSLSPNACLNALAFIPLTAGTSGTLQLLSSSSSSTSSSSSSSSSTSSSSSSSTSSSSSSSLTPASLTRLPAPAYLHPRISHRLSTSSSTPSSPSLPSSTLSPTDESKVDDGLYALSCVALSLSSFVNKAHNVLYENGTTSTSSSSTSTSSSSPSPSTPSRPPETTTDNARMLEHLAYIIAIVAHSVLLGGNDKKADYEAFYTTVMNITHFTTSSAPSSSSSSSSSSPSSSSSSPSSSSSSSPSSLPVTLKEQLTQQSLLTRRPLPPLLTGLAVMSDSLYQYITDTSPHQLTSMVNRLSTTVVPSFSLTLTPFAPSATTSDSFTLSPLASYLRTLFLLALKLTSRKSLPQPLLPITTSPSPSSTTSPTPVPPTTTRPVATTRTPLTSASRPPRSRSLLSSCGACCNLAYRPPDTTQTNTARRQTTPTYNTDRHDFTSSEVPVEVVSYDSPPPSHRPQQPSLPHPSPSPSTHGHSAPSSPSPPTAPPALGGMTEPPALTQQQSHRPSRTSSSIKLSAPSSTATTTATTTATPPPPLPPPAATTISNLPVAKPLTAPKSKALKASPKALPEYLMGQLSSAASGKERKGFAPSPIPSSSLSTSSSSSSSSSSLEDPKHQLYMMSKEKSQLKKKGKGLKFGDKASMFDDDLPQDTYFGGTMLEVDAQSEHNAAVEMEAEKASGLPREGTGYTTLPEPSMGEWTGEVEDEEEINMAKRSSAMYDDGDDDAPADLIQVSSQVGITTNGDVQAGGYTQMEEMLVSTSTNQGQGKKEKEGAIREETMKQPKAEAISARIMPYAPPLVVPESQFEVTVWVIPNEKKYEKRVQAVQSMQDASETKTQEVASFVKGDYIVVDIASPFALDPKTIDPATHLPAESPTSPYHSDLPKATGKQSSNMMKVLNGARKYINDASAKLSAAVAVNKDEVKEGEEETSSAGQVSAGRMRVEQWDGQPLCFNYLMRLPFSYDAAWDYVNRMDSTRRTYLGIEDGNLVADVDVSVQSIPRNIIGTLTDNSIQQMAEEVRAPSSSAKIELTMRIIIHRRRPEVHGALKLINLVRLQTCVPRLIRRVLVLCSSGAEKSIRKGKRPASFTDWSSVSTQSTHNSLLFVHTNVELRSEHQDRWLAGVASGQLFSEYDAVRILLPSGYNPQRDTDLSEDITALINYVRGSTTIPIRHVGGGGHYTVPISRYITVVQEGIASVPPELERFVAGWAVMASDDLLKSGQLNGSDHATNYRASTQIFEDEYVTHSGSIHTNENFQIYCRNRPDQIPLIPFDQFEIAERIGEGNFGQVVKGKYKGLETHMLPKIEELKEGNVALKRIGPCGLEKWNTASINMAMELTAQYVCSPLPGVCPIIGYTMDDNNFYIVGLLMEKSLDAAFVPKNQTMRRLQPSLDVLELLNSEKSMTGANALVRKYQSKSALQRMTLPTDTTTDTHPVTRELLRILCDAAIGLRSVHTIMLRHDDVALRNFLLDKQGSCYVTDFGLATYLGGLDQEAAQRNVPVHTLAPEGWTFEKKPLVVSGCKCLTDDGSRCECKWDYEEAMTIIDNCNSAMLEPKGKLSLKSDVYSFGVLMYESIIKQQTDIALIKPGNLTAVSRARALKLPYMDALPETCPKELESLVFDCLRYNAERRPTMAEVAKRLYDLWKNNEVRLV